MEYQSFAHGGDNPVRTYGRLPLEVTVDWVTRPTSNGIHNRTTDF